MNLRPLGNQVLLSPIPYVPSFDLSIVIPERYTPEVWEWRIVSCGSKVPEGIRPGARVLVDPTSLAQRDFEYGGTKFKLAPFKEVQMVVGVAP